MKASELIKKLQKEVDANQDYDVMLYDDKAPTGLAPMYAIYVDFGEQAILLKAKYEWNYEV